jgi:hypothetical protein
MNMKVAVICAVLISFAAVHAVDYEQTRKAAERCADWLIGKYNPKENVFGSGPDASAPEELAMVVKGLCESPRDCKEASGSYIAEPLKRVIASIDAKNELAGAKMAQAEALLWALSAFKVCGNPAYAPLIEKLRKHVKELPQPAVPELKLEHLSPASAGRETLRNALAAIHQFHGTNEKELAVNGQKVKWAEVLSSALVKLQEPDGSFGADIQTNALALYELNLCYRALK